MVINERSPWCLPACLHFTRLARKVVGEAEAPQRGQGRHEGQAVKGQVGGGGLPAHEGVQGEAPGVEEGGEAPDAGGGVGGLFVGFA